MPPFQWNPIGLHRLIFPRDSQNTLHTTKISKHVSQSIFNVNTGAAEWTWILQRPGQVTFLASLILMPPCVKYVKVQVHYMNSTCSCCPDSAKQIMWLWPSYTTLTSLKAIKIMVRHYRIVEYYMTCEVPSTVLKLLTLKYFMNAWIFSTKGLKTTCSK